MENVTLRRSCDWFRPLFFYKDELHGEEIGQIKIFDGVNVYTVHRGFLENENDRGRDIKEMYFQELSKKRNIDLTLKKSFLAKAENWHGDKVLTLFLYAPKIESEVVKGIETEHGANFVRKLYFSFNGVDVCQIIPDHYEKSEIAKQAELLKEELNKDLFIKLDAYTLTKILTKYNMIKK